MRVLLDNNLSPHIAEALEAVGEDVLHVKDIFLDQSPDEKILQYCADKGCMLVTLDKKLRYRPAIATATQEYRIGIFILQGKDKSRWERFCQLVRAWRVRAPGMSRNTPSKN